MTKSKEDNRQTRYQTIIEGAKDGIRIKRKNGKRARKKTKG